MKISILICLFLTLISVNAKSSTFNNSMLCTSDDPDFDGFRYEEQIAHCKRNVSSKTKTEIYRAYGISENDRGLYYIDHFISLSCSGSNHISNLIPIKRNISTTKIEMQVYHWLKSGLINQEMAVGLLFDFKSRLLNL